MFKKVWLRKCFPVVLLVLLLGMLIPGVAQAFADGDGSEGDPYQISNVEQLQDIRLHLSAHFVLINDIEARATEDWNDGAGFAPIGPFSGSLDGQGFEIRNLFINRRGRVGLFSSTTSGATISHVRLVNVNIAGGGWDTGALVGSNHGTITNSSSTGTVSEGWSIGGLVGDNRGTIENSSSSVTVSGASNVGGLVGDNNGTITNSFSTGAVSGTLDRVGGLVGSSSGTIERSFSLGAVKGRHEVGGLVGDNWWGEVRDSYSRGAVSGSSRVGGLVGRNPSGSVITRSYSTGAVSGDAVIGGLVGDNTGGTITASFWDMDTSGLTSGVGAGEEGASGRTTPEMKRRATFVGWDFIDIWNIREGEDYPFHRWAEIPTISASPLSFGFSLAPGEATFEILEIKNTGGGVLVWKVEEHQPWLSLDPLRGSSRDAADVHRVTISVDTAGLTLGIHEGAITITAPGADNTPQTVPVALEIVVLPATIEYIPPSLSFSAIQGRPNPPSRTLEIRDIGGGILNWEVRADRPWLSLAPLRGSSTGEWDEVTVSVDTAGLTPGIHRGTITITAPGATNTPQTVPVTLALDINTPPAAPTHLSALATTSCQIWLSWKDQSDNEDGFKIERKESGGLFSPIARKDPDVTSFNDRNLSAHTTYYYRVQAFNELGVNYSNVVSATTFREPAPPPLPEVEDRACFIATAAFGTPMAGEVKLLSQFRDRYLLTNELGRRFVVFYYKHSPQWAELISGNNSLKTLVRMGLRPLIWLARLTIED